MFGPIRAVAIDDEPSHLLAITTGLTAIGIPCVGFWWDRASNEMRPAPPPGGMPFLRLVFMDLNLAEQGGVPDASNLATVVMSALKQLVSLSGGPYLLAFWTQVGTRVEAVGKIIYERLEKVENVPAPVSIIELDKKPFLIQDPAKQDFSGALKEFYAALHGNIDALRAAVQKAVEHEPTLSALSSWESRAAEAAASAVNQIHGCATIDSPQPERRIDSVQKVMAKVAVAAAGESAAQDNPAGALDAGMVDILVDQFGVSVDAPSYQAVVKAALGEAVKAAVAFRDEVAMAAALNTFFHVDDDTSSAKAGDRGVVIATGGFNKNDLGFKPIDYLHEFLIPHETFESGRRAEMKALYEACRKSAEVVLIELGADCDHAQNTARTRRYLLGIEVPVRFTELLTFPDNRKLRSEALQLLGPWRLGGQIKWLLVSCRRFWAWQERTPHAKGTVKYRLRASIVSKLLHHYATFHSRPGIVEFPSHATHQTILYFAYGSNMLSARLRERVPSAIVVGAGHVQGQKLAFDKPSDDGSGKCTMRPGDPQDCVHGVLFTIDASERPQLDRHEGLDAGYEYGPITVTAAQGACEAFVYRATATDESLRPYDWYQELVVAGAIEHKLPDDYINALRAVEAQVDSDASRKEANRALLPKTK